MDLYFLGTGAGLPSKQRNVTSIALRLNQERRTFWLFDCGEGTQHQMLGSPLRPTRLEKIFITHLHGDHIYGLPGLLGSRAFQAGDTTVTIYGPVGIRSFVETALQVSQSHLSYPLQIEEIEEGLVFEDEAFRVTCKQLVHGVPSYGYRVEEKAQAGPLLQDKLAAEGVQAGPVYARLKRGEDVTLDNGRVLVSRDYVGESIPGRVVVILGDTRPCEATVTLAEGADLLVHEATYRVEDKERAARHNHSTSVDAATAAAQANVKQLVVTHISARYEGEQLVGLVEEARSTFPNTEIASDHWSIDIPRVKKHSRD